MISVASPAGTYRPVAALARRSLRSTWRQPQTWIPAIVFPLLLAAVNSSAMSRAIALPGFGEVDSFLQFLLPASLLQGVLFGGLFGGTEIALDVESGFFERLVASPVQRLSIVAGRLAGATALGGIQAAFFIVVFVTFGAPIAGGVPAVVGLVLIGMVLALAIGGVAAGLGFRTGSQEAVQGVFPLAFIGLFVSSAFFPTEQMTGLYRTVAEVNPLTWMIDAARHLVVVGFDWSELGTALAVGAALSALSLRFAIGQLNWRVAGSQ